MVATVFADVSINSGLLDAEVTAIVTLQVISVRPKQHAKVKPWSEYVFGYELHEEYREFGYSRGVATSDS